MIPKTCTISPDFLWDRPKPASNYFYIYFKKATNLNFFHLIPQQYEIYLKLSTNLVKPRVYYNNRASFS